MKNEIKFIGVEGGTFQMGSKDGEIDERPVHKVKVDSFVISQYPVTFAQYDEFCEATRRKKPSDSGWGRGERPVINVSWDDAVAFCEWVSKETGTKIRLPYEAEWEFAARKYNGSRKFSGSNDLNTVGWYYGNSRRKTHPVGRKQPNELGIYDMSGNVWEWCMDRDGLYEPEPQTNPKGSVSGFNRVIRGGAWDSKKLTCRVRYRGVGIPYHEDNSIGFRVVREKGDAMNVARLKAILEKLPGNMVVLVREFSDPEEPCLTTDVKVEIISQKITYAENRRYVKSQAGEELLLIS